MGDYYNYYEGGGGPHVPHSGGSGGGSDDGSNLTWLWVLIALALVGICGWFIWRVLKSRKRLTEGGGSVASD